jgi:PAS domain S-box-containing protein
MDELRDLLEIAQFMLDRYGVDAASVMDERASLHERDGETEMAEFWSRVARAVRGLQARPGLHEDGPAGPDRPGGPALHDLAFRSAPQPYLLIGPDLTIADANEAFLAATATRREEIVGRRFSAVFPDAYRPAHPTAVCLLEASLARALESGRPDPMSPLRLAVRRADGVLEERWWRPLNAPVLDQEGRLALVIQNVEDVTVSVRRGGAPGAHDPD